MRPLFFSHGRRASVVDFSVTTGHTEPAARPVPGVHVLPAQEWLSDDDLARLTAEEREEARREVVRARLAAVQADWKFSRREWAIYLVALVAGLCAVAWLPNPGFGWHFAALGLLAP